MNQPLGEPTNFTLLTPPGRGAVATIAVRGVQAAELVEGLFRSKTKSPLSRRQLGRICFGRWNDSENGEEIVVCRRDTRLVEIHCHGGQAAAASILADLRDAGCVETTQWNLNREYHDAITAAAAEALAEARTERTAAILLDQHDGALRRELEKCLALLETGRTSEVDQLIGMLAQRGRLGIHLTAPWRVVIAGAPNVGKSTLLNAIVGYDRSIVVDSPGTTRDVVATGTIIDGWPVLLSDTAGIRNTDDDIEATGVTLAEEQLAKADLIVLLFDQSITWSSAAQGLFNRWPDALIVHNKSDLPGEVDDGRPPGLAACAKRSEGLPQLLEQISSRLVPEAPIVGQAVPFTPEQIQRLQSAKAASERHDHEAAANDIRQMLD